MTLWTRPDRRFALSSALIISSYPQLSTGKVIIFSLRSVYSTVERSGEVRVHGQWGGNSWAGGIGLGGLEGGGSSGWGVGETQYRKHVNSLPNGPVPHFR